jgi:hypothetical protein
MKKRKVKRYEIGGDVEDNYARNENREGRMSTLDPSDVEDAIRGRQMTGTLGKVEYPNRLREAAEAAGTTGEDTGVGLLSGVTRPVKPAVRPSVRPAVKPPVAPPVQPVSGGGRGTMAGPTAAQIEEGRKKFAEDQGRRNLERLQREDKPLERVNPEANLMGGPALRGAKAMATGLREAADFVKQRMARSAAPSAVKQLGQSGRQAENLTKDMGPVEFAAGKRSMLQNQRGEGVITPPAAPFAERNKRMLMQNQRGEGVITPPAPVRPPRGGGKDPGARRPTRDELDEMRMGSDYMRKGGKVKAYKSGGSVGSASKRADGIAMRGKTRGKYI